MPVAAGASQTGDTTATAVVAGFGFVEHVGQTFTVPAGTDDYLYALEITGFNRVSPNTTNHIFISAVDGGGLPTGPALYTSPGFSGPSGISTVKVYPNLSVTPGVKYAFYTEGSPGVSFQGSAPGVYAGGEIVEQVVAAGAWSAQPNDIAFLADFNTGQMKTFTTVSCAGPGKVGKPTNCTATLKSGNGPEATLTGKQVVLGNVLNPSGSFSNCFVDATGSCSGTFTPAAAGADTVTATFVQDGSHLTSGDSTGLTVNPRSNSAQTAAGCTPAIMHVGETATCSVIVSDTDMSSTRTTPSGATSWSSTGGGTFAGGGACSLTPQSLGVSKCTSIAYTPTAPGAHSITSAYAGDASHLASASASAGTLTVLPVAVPEPGATGQRAAALKKCKKKHSKAKRKKCRKKALKLPV
jgi:hypothetical protein